MGQLEEFRPTAYRRRVTMPQAEELRPTAYRPTALLTTEQAALATGLSQWELRAGWKSGKYPALAIGSGGKRQRLRWRLDLLEAAIVKAMQEQEQEDARQIMQEWDARRRG